MRPQEVARPRLLSISATAQILGVSERSIWRLVGRREIATVRVGGRRLVPTAEVDRIASTTTSRGT